MDSISTAAPSPNTAVHGAARLTRMTNMLMVPYLAAVFVLMIGLKVTPSPDVVVVLLALCAVLMGRGLSFVRDWGPFLATFLAWEMMRGIANQFGQAVHSDSVIAIERALFAGNIPTVVLQSALYEAGTVNWYDVLLTVTYSSHFFFPVAFAFFLWLRRRERYYPYVAALMLTSFAAFATFLVLPVAPPRFALNTARPWLSPTWRRRPGPRSGGTASTSRIRTSSGTPSPRSRPCTLPIRCLWRCSSPSARAGRPCSGYPSCF